MLHSSEVNLYTKENYRINCLFNARQIGSFPQVGVKIKMFETTT